MRAEEAPAGLPRAPLGAARARTAIASGAGASARRSRRTARSGIPRPLDLAAPRTPPRRCSLGEHDFRAFTPTDTQHDVFVRAVEDARWHDRGDHGRARDHRRLVPAPHGADARRDDARARARRPPPAPRGRAAQRRRLDRPAVGPLPGRASATDAVAYDRPCASPSSSSTSTAPSSTRRRSSSPRCGTPRGGARARDPDDELMAAVGGPGLEAQMRAFAPDRVDELVRVYRAHNEPLHDELEAFAGMDDVLVRLKDEGRRLGIVSAKRRSTVELAFARVPLGHLFDVSSAATRPSATSPTPSRCCSRSSASAPSRRTPRTSATRRTTCGPRRRRASTRSASRWGRIHDRERLGRAPTRRRHGGGAACRPLIRRRAPPSCASCSPLALIAYHVARRRRPSTTRPTTALYDELVALEAAHPELVTPDSPTQRVGAPLVGAVPEGRST